jgi:hypothetical protein
MMQFSFSSCGELRIRQEVRHSKSAPIDWIAVPSMIAEPADPAIFWRDGQLRTSKKPAADK